jgi:hypothetical protein
MRGRRFKTPSDINRYVAQGYGQGQGVDYRPWLRVQDIPSLGRSRKVQGCKIPRSYHLLSDLEYAYFVVLEFSDRVLDIREQYPLFPVSDLQQIAQAKGIRYPRYAGTDLPFVLTTDFLLTIQTDAGPKLAARTVKYSSELAPSATLERTLQKLELEQTFWVDQGVSWGIVTELAIDANLSENLHWLRGGAVIERHLMQEALQQRFLDAFDRLDLESRTLAANVRRVGQAIHLPYKDALMVFKHLAWRKAIQLDLKAAPLRLTGATPPMHCVGTPAAPIIQAVA